jgi:short subunit dehydrogenase-like uncharacterized protein
MGHPYGRDFVCDEMMLSDQPPSNPFIKRAKVIPPAPGDGPTDEQRRAGSYEMIFIAVARDGRKLRVCVKGDADAGHGSTAKVMAETALCLRKAQGALPGVWTPVASCSAHSLIRCERMQD